MKKRKGNFLQKMLAVLLTAALTAGMVESGTPLTMAAQEDTVSGNSRGSYAENRNMEKTAYEAKIGETEYATLGEAVEAAVGGTEDNPVCIEILSHISLSETIGITGCVRLVSEGDYVICRNQKFTSPLFQIKKGGMLTLGNQEGMKGTITIDGGAVWTGEPDPVLGRGTVNTGITSEASLFEVSGSLNIYSGVILQNNDCHNSGEELGGAVQIMNSAGMLDMAGGVIRNNHSSSSGGAIISNGQIIMTDGKIYGNDAEEHGGAIQTKAQPFKKAEFSMSGGIIRNNRCNGYGGGLVISDSSTFNMSGEAMIINNSTTGEGDAVGGGVAFAEARTTMNVSGNVKIFGNTWDGETENLYIDNAKNNLLTTGDLGSKARIGVTLTKGTDGMYFGVDATGGQSRAESRIFVDSGGNGVFYDGSAYLRLGGNLGIMMQPQAPDYPDDNTMEVLVLSDDNRDFSYQWYCWKEDGSEEKAVGSSDEAKYCLPDNLPEGEHAYFCVATDKDGYSVTSDIVKIKVEAVYFTINFDANGGSGNMDPVKVKEGTSCALPECTFTAPSGKKFKGWAIDRADGTVVNAGAGCTVSKDTTIYAVWEDTDEKKAEAAGIVAMDVMDTITPENSLTADIIKGKIEKALEDADFTGITVTVENFTITPATEDSAGVIMGSIYVRCGSVTKNFSFSQPVPQLPKTHVHDWKKDTWERNESHHWHPCGNADCPVMENSKKDGYTEHKFDTWKQNADSHWKECGDCGYRKDEAGHVYTNSSDMTCDECGYDRTSSDKSAPTGTVSIEENKWTSFLNAVTFGLFFKETKQAVIAAEDKAGSVNSGVDKVYYYVSDRALTKAEAESLEDSGAKSFGKEGWTEGASVSLKPDRKCVVYAKIRDKAGNVTYLSSDGLVFDKTAPEIIGVRNGESYTGPITVTVTDENLDTVTVNGEEAVLTDGKFTLSAAPGPQCITATDKAGNAAQVTVTVTEETKKTDAQKVEAAKQTAGGVIKDIVPMNGITPDNIQSEIKKALTAAGLTDVEVNTDGLTITPATAGMDGSIQGIIEIRSGDTVGSIPVNITIPKTGGGNSNNNDNSDNNNDNNNDNSHNNNDNSDNNNKDNSNGNTGYSGSNGSAGGDGNRAAKAAVPKMGDKMHLELYATTAMIAGFIICFWYFSDRIGMAEETKRELISKLTGWAKKGGRLRKLLALAAIFVLLAYYHSIGRKTDSEWREICEK